MRFSVCIDSVFRGWDALEAMKAVRASGFGAYEFWGWWDKDVRAIRAAKEELGLETAALCTKFISLVDPAQRQAYKQGLMQTLAVAEQLGCTTIISQVGAERPGIPREEQHESLVRGLRDCAPLLRDHGAALVIEPLNTLVDHRGYYLWSSAEAFSVVDEVASANVRVLFDIYHQQIMEGNLIANITPHIDKIGHFHAAGVPGRHELETGEIDYARVFEAIRQAGYEGAVGLEYMPAKDPVAGLKELGAKLPVTGGRSTPF